MRVPPLLLIGILAVIIVIGAMLLGVSRIQDFLMERSSEMDTISSTKQLSADDTLRVVGPVEAAETTIDTRWLS